MTNKAAPTPFQCTLSPRYTDLDTWRHVNNSRVYQLHLEARVRAHVQRFGEDSWFSDDVRLRPLRTMTQFLQVTWYGSDIDARVQITACDENSFQLFTELYQNDVLVGTQQSLMAAFKKGRQVPLPSDIQQAMASAITGDLEPFPSAAYRDQLAQAHNFAVREQLTPRYADLDADSQRSEAALALYMEQARSNAIRQLDLGDLGMLIAAVDISFENYRPGWGPVELAAGINRIGNSSFQFTGCALHKGEVQAAANSIMVIIDPATNRPVPIPPALREQLKAWSI